MTAILECQECGHQAVYEQEDGLDKCPECNDIHVDVTYGVLSYKTRIQVAEEAGWRQSAVGTWYHPDKPFEDALKEPPKKINV